jgi:hypothetical protein
MRRWNHLVTGDCIISENQKFYNHNFGISEIAVIAGWSEGADPESMAPPERWDEWIPGPVLWTVLE